MESNEKGKAPRVNIITISYKDLVRHPKNGKPEQIRPGDPEWDDGIACIKAYQAQATTLTQAQQEEMRDLIKGLDYVMCPTAVGVPQPHKFYRTTMKKFNSEGQAPSWPVFIILTTLYDTLPKRYIKMVREAHGKTKLFDHTKEYLAIEGTEPAEPPKPQGNMEKPQPRQMKQNFEGGSDPRESAEDNEVAISSASPSSTESEEEDLELAPVSNLINKVRSDQPTSNNPLVNWWYWKDVVYGLEDDSMDYLGDYPMYPQPPVPMSLSRVNPPRDANSAQMSSNTAQKRRASPTATEGDDPPAKKHPKLPELNASSSLTKVFEPGQHRGALSKEDFYSRMVDKIRDKNSSALKEPPSCSCQTEVQELRKVINTMDDTFEQVVKKLDTMNNTIGEAFKKLDAVARDARIHRKGTQRLIAAANGEKTPADSDNDA